MQCGHAPFVSLARLDFPEDIDQTRASSPARKANLNKGSGEASRRFASAGTTLNSGSEIAPSELVCEIIARAPAERHDGPSRVLTGSADKSTAVNHKQVLHIMGLLELV
jgi:hypothetical protein